MTTTVFQRMAAGDQAAMTECIDRYGGLVWMLARRLLDGRIDIEDAVQDVFVELWRMAPRYDPKVASEKAFVAMIARRRLIDRGRRERRKVMGVTGLSAAEAQRRGPGPANASGGGSSPEDEPRIAGDEARRAAEALLQLRAAEQTVIRMAVLDGLSHQEIADRLGSPIGTVKTNLRRGFLKLREIILGGDDQPSRSRERSESSGQEGP